MLSIFFNFNAVIFVTITIVASLLFYLKIGTKKPNFDQVISLAQQLTYAVSLIYIMVVLSDLTNMDKVARGLHFLISSNIYVSLISIGIKIRTRTSHT